MRLLFINGEGGKGGAILNFAQGNIILKHGPYYKLLKYTCTEQYQFSTIDYLVLKLLVVE